MTDQAWENSWRKEGRCFLEICSLLQSIAHQETAPFGLWSIPVQTVERDDFILNMCGLMNDFKICITKQAFHNFLRSSSFTYPL